MTKDEHALLSGLEQVPLGRQHRGISKRTSESAMTKERNMKAERESIYRNAFSLALWDGKTDTEADKIAEAAVLRADAEQDENSL
jgi:hypothetical protein